MITHTITNDTITVIIDGNVKQVARRTNVGELVLSALLSDESSVSTEQYINDLISSDESMLKAYSDGRLTFTPEDHELTLDGVTLDGKFAEKIIDNIQNGVPFRYLVNFFDKLKKNVSHRAIKELYNFLAHRGISITESGNFLAYKGVQENSWSCRGNLKTIVLQGDVDEGGHIYHAVGRTIEVKRSCVDDNANNGCGEGIHAGSYEYANGWGARLYIVEIDPADVVSIPTDCNCQKLRTCKYKIVSEARQSHLPYVIANSEQPYINGERVYMDVPEERGDVDSGRIQIIITDNASLIPDMSFDLYDDDDDDVADYEEEEHMRAEEAEEEAREALKERILNYIDNSKVTY
jgi:hypothetical protein